MYEFPFLYVNGGSYYAVKIENDRVIKTSLGYEEEFAETYGKVFPTIIKLNKDIMLLSLPILGTKPKVYRDCPDDDLFLKKAIESVIEIDSSMAKVTYMEMNAIAFRCRGQWHSCTVSKDASEYESAEFLCNPIEIVINSRNNKNGSRFWDSALLVDDELVFTLQENLPDYENHFNSAKRTMERLEALEVLSNLNDFGMLYLRDEDNVLTANEIIVAPGKAISIRKLGQISPMLFEHLKALRTATILTEVDTVLDNAGKSVTAISTVQFSGNKCIDESFQTLKGENPKDKEKVIEDSAISAAISLMGALYEQDLDNAPNIWGLSKLNRIGIEKYNKATGKLTEDFLPNKTTGAESVPVVQK